MKYKKIINSLGAMAIIASPIALAVSCGPKEGKGIVIISVPNTATSVNAKMRDWGANVAKSLGYKAITVETNEKVEVEFKKIKTLIDAGGVRVLVMAPAQAVGSEAIVKYARKKGVIVTTMDRTLKHKELVDGQIYNDDYKVAKTIMTHALDFYEKNKNGDFAWKGQKAKELEFMILAGDAKSANGVARGLGPKQYIKSLFKAPEKNIYLDNAKGWKAENSLSAAISFLAAHPGIDMIITAATPQTEGAVGALRKVAKLKKIPIFAYDAEHKLDKYLKDGTLIGAAMQRFDFFTKWAVERGIKVYEKNKKEKTKLPEIKASDFENGKALDLNKNDMPINGTWITKDNIDSELF